MANITGELLIVKSQQLKAASVYETGSNVSKMI